MAVDRAETEPAHKTDSAEAAVAVGPAVDLGLDYSRR